MTFQPDNVERILEIVKSEFPKNGQSQEQYESDIRIISKDVYLLMLKERGQLFLKSILEGIANQAPIKRALQRVIQLYE